MSPDEWFTPFQKKCSAYVFEVKQSKNYKLDSMTLIMKTLCSFKMLETTHRKTQRSIPTHLNLQHQYYLWTHVAVKINSTNFGGISLLQDLGMLQIPHNSFKIIIHAASVYTNILVIYSLTGSYLLNVRMLRHPKPAYWLHDYDGGTPFQGNIYSVLLIHF